LKVTKNCLRLLYEISRYRNKPKADGSGFDVLKKDDHSVDATRYLVCEHPQLNAWDVPQKRGYYGFDPTRITEWDYRQPKDYGPLGSMA